MTIKKFLASTILLTFSFSQFALTAMAYNCPDGEVEHMQAVKNSKIDLVKITPGGNVIQKENSLVVNFAQNFN